MLNRGTSFFVSGYLCKVCFQRFRAGGRGCDGERGVFVYSYVILSLFVGSLVDAKLRVLQSLLAP